MSRPFVYKLAASSLIVFAVIVAASVYRQADGASGPQDGPTKAAHSRLERSSVKPRPENRALVEERSLADFVRRVGGLERPDVHSLTEEYLSALDLPDPGLMASSELSEFLRVIAIVGDSVHIKATTRFAFIRDHVPNDWLKTTADDMLRFLSHDELRSVLPLIADLPAGGARTEMYRLATLRMVRLRLPHDEVEGWIGTLENQDERDAAGLVLKFESP